MGVLLIIIKWIGIVVLSLMLLAIFLLGIVFLVPAKYTGEYKKTEEEDSLLLRFRIYWLLFVLQYNATYEEGQFSQCLKVFGIKIHPKKKKEESDKKQSIKKKNKKNKKKHLFSTIKNFKKNILNRDNILAFNIFINELKRLFKHWGPRKLKAELCFSMGDPAYTGMVLGIISVFPIVYKEDVLLKSDFESDKMYLNGQAKFKGHIRAVHAAKLMFNLFSKKETRNIISKMNK